MKTKQFQRVDRKSVDRVVGGLRSITPRDEAIFRALERYRFLSADHLHELVQPTGSYREITKRLQKLYHHRYVDRPRKQLHLWDKGRKPFVYALGDEGARVLRERGASVPVGVARWTKKNRDVTPYHLAHTLMVNGFLVALVQALRGTGIELTWHTEREWPAEPLHVAVPIGPGRTHRVPIRPDAYFTLYPIETPHGSRRRHFFLEADRATEPLRRPTLFGSSLYKHYIGYWYWGPKGRLCRQIGLPGFYVLTVTTSLERARNLHGLVRETVLDQRRGDGCFWFTAEEEYREPKNLLEGIWLNAVDPKPDKRHFLLEP